MKDLVCIALIPVNNEQYQNNFNFDAVYENLVLPSIKDAELTPLLYNTSDLDESLNKNIFQSFILCDYAVIDITTANSKVFYALGIRHAYSPYTTIIIYNKQILYSLDLNMFEAIPYEYNVNKPQDSNFNIIKKQITCSLLKAKNLKSRGSLYQILDNFCGIQHLKTDVFREQVRYDHILKKQLEGIRKNNDVQSLRHLISSLGDISLLDYEIIIDIFLSYRAISNKKEEWIEMTEFIKQMPKPLANTTLIQEQFAFSLNRSGHYIEAEKVLNDLLNKKGPSSETYGLLGRVYKDLWEKSLYGTEVSISNQYLNKSINAYLKGFETDWRDAYPGINAINLLFIRNSNDNKLKQLIPLVRYAVERRINSGLPDYWDYAALLELAIISDDKVMANFSVNKATKLIREKWEVKNTVKSIRRLITYTTKRSDSITWINEILNKLESKLD